jgi:phage tail sheath gpL-like
MTVSTAVDLSAVARVVGIKTEYKDLRGGAAVFLPQRLALLGQGNDASTYSLTKRTVLSAFEVGSTYGFGSPLHLSALQLMPVNGDGIGTIPLTIYPLTPAASSAALGTITPSVTTALQSEYIVRVNNIDTASFTVPAGSVVADITALATNAINAVEEMPVIAADATTSVGLTVKWGGASGDDVYVEIVGPTDQGVTFAVIQPTAGAGGPSVAEITTALAQMGNVWESFGLNCIELADTAVLDYLQTFGEGRWGALVKKPMIWNTGFAPTTVSSAITISDARKTDRINGQLVAVGSKDLPFVIAAREMARIIKEANNNPARDYGSQAATGLTGGADGDQWDYVSKDAAVKGGSSTTDVIDGVVTLSDTVTFYHPTGDPLPAYRYQCDIVKLQQVLFNLDLLFNNAEWDGAPLVPDSDPTTNPSTKKPKMAVAEIAALLDSLALSSIISDPATAKQSIVAQISGTNPKRLDISLTIQLAGNANIISIDNNFGFFFGTAEAA